MRKDELMLGRLCSVWKMHGSIGLIQRLLRRISPIHKSLVYQKNRPSNACSIYGLLIQRYSSRSAVSLETMESLKKAGGDATIRQVNKLFSKGCELWIGQMEGQVAGICWSWIHEIRRDYFVPIDKTDAGILSCIVFPAFRGRGIYPAILEKMVNSLFAQDQIRNVYIDCESWNTASTRGIQKAGFVSIGKAIRIILFDKVWIIWNQCRPISS